METKEQNRLTKPVDNFGTAPNANPSLKITDYNGQLLKNRYLVEGELGRGGIGVVYLARDTQLLNRRVVIKVLLESSEQSLHTPWFRKKFDQEVEALVRIDHPGVVGVLDVGVMPDGKPFFVMQYVEGINLRKLMEQETPMDFARLAHIVRQIGQALTAAHEKGVIHRDLKPENVMVQKPVEGEEVIKLIDFGIATVKDSQTNKTEASKTKVAGALPYMAPEQLRGEPQAASDTWSLGVMAYEMLTGQLPFQAETLLHLHDQQKQGPPPPSHWRGDLPPAAEFAVMRSLAYAPDERYGRARDFGDALAEALLNSIPRTYPTKSTNVPDFSTNMAPSATTQIGMGAVPLSVTVDTPKPAPGKSPLPYFAAFVVLLAGVIGVVGYWKMRQTKPPVAPPMVPARQLAYSLSARLLKNAGGKPVELAGEIVFSPGDQLRLNLSSPQDGYLYLISEGPQPSPKTGLPLYNLLFPEPANTNAPTVRAKQTIYLPGEQPPWFPVDKEEGTEKLWLIWAETPVQELEQVRKWLNTKDRGEIKDDNEVKAAQEFLQRNFNNVKPRAEISEGQTHLSLGSGNVLVYPVRLQHF